MSHSRSVLIRGGTLVTHGALLDADVLARDGTIQAIGRQLAAPDNADIYDATGLLVFPGFIDAHTHIQLNTGIYATADDWASGSRAAAFGGITTVVDFATQFKGQCFADAARQRLDEADASVIDYALHMMVTDVAPGAEDVLGELPELGIQSIKLYTTYRPNYYADDATILRLLEAAAFYGLTSLVHCENDALVTARTQALIDGGRTGWRYHGMSRPALGEREAAARVLMLAQAVGAPVVIAHASLPETVALVAHARKEGLPAFVETTPQYLLLDSSCYAGEEPWRYILQPPLRELADREGLSDRVSEGFVDMLVTDHCAYTAQQKTAVDDFTRTPGGLPGVETLVPLMATWGREDNRLDWIDLARMMSYNPARIYNLWPQKGTLMPGADADIVIFDPTGESVVHASDLHMGTDYTPYEGLRLQGQIKTTLRRGEYLVRDGVFTGSAGGGRYIGRAPSMWE